LSSPQNQLLSALGRVEFLVTDAEALGRLAEKTEEPFGGSMSARPAIVFACDPGAGYQGAGRRRESPMRSILT
jgi:hypothetical protein